MHTYHSLLFFCFSFTFLCLKDVRIYLESFWSAVYRLIFWLWANAASFYHTEFLVKGRYIRQLCVEKCLLTPLISIYKIDYFLFNFWALAWISLTFLMTEWDYWVFWVSAALSEFRLAALRQVNLWEPAVSTFVSSCPPNLYTCMHSHTFTIALFFLCVFLFYTIFLCYLDHCRHCKTSHFYTLLIIHSDKATALPVTGRMKGPNDKSCKTGTEKQKRSNCIRSNL